MSGFSSDWTPATANALSTHDDRVTIKHLAPCNIPIKC